MVISGKERAWINKQHKAMRNFKGDGTITANKLLEANECVCLCLWQWLRGVNRRISSHLRSLNTSHCHNWIKSVRLLLNCGWHEEHATHEAQKITSTSELELCSSLNIWTTERRMRILKKHFQVAFFLKLLLLLFFCLLKFCAEIKGPTSICGKSHACILLWVYRQNNINNDDNIVIYYW